MLCHIVRFSNILQEVALHTSHKSAALPFTYMYSKLVLHWYVHINLDYTTNHNIYSVIKGQFAIILPE